MQEVKNMRLFERLVLCLLVLVTSNVSFAAETGKQRLEKFINQTTTFEALFTQEVVSEDGKVAPAATGKVQLSRPGRFNWEYEKPYPQKIIADGKNVWVYDQDLEQVTVKPLDDALGATPVALLTQKADLMKNFQVIEQDSRESLSWVELKPKQEDTDFQRILIGLDHEGIKGMDLFDQFGQMTVIRFHQAVFNTKIPDSRFQFIPPDGVDIIGQPS